MATLGLNHCNLRAHPELLGQLRDFYCDVIGLKVGPRPPFDNVGYWLYAGNQPIIHLTESAVIEPVASSFDHIAFSCTELGDFKQRLAQYGVDYTVSYVPQTTQVQLFLRDPAFNGVELNFANE